MEDEELVQCIRCEAMVDEDSIIGYGDARFCDICWDDL